jgi:hypothetical protein
VSTRCLRFSAGFSLSVSRADTKPYTASLMRLHLVRLSRYSRAFSRFTGLAVFSAACAFSGLLQYAGLCLLSVLILCFAALSYPLSSSLYPGASFPLLLLLASVASHGGLSPMLVTARLSAGKPGEDTHLCADATPALRIVKERGRVCFPATCIAALETILPLDPRDTP